MVYWRTDGALSKANAVHSGQQGEKVASVSDGQEVSIEGKTSDMQWVGKIHGDGNWSFERIWQAGALTTEAEKTIRKRNV